MVVNGRPPYIMTYDKSKYYIGALLPSGHKIVSIIDNSVILEKQGKQTTLKF
jgi:type III secretion protein D